jgi:hypothetical protein
MWLGSLRRTNDRRRLLLQEDAGALVRRGLGETWRQFVPGLLVLVRLCPGVDVAAGRASQSRPRDCNDRLPEDAAERVERLPRAWHGVPAALAAVGRGRVGRRGADDVSPTVATRCVRSPYRRRRTRCETKRKDKSRCGWREKMGKDYSRKPTRAAAEGGKFSQSTLTAPLNR